MKISFVSSDPCSWALSQRKIMTLFFLFSRKLGSPFFNVFPALALVSHSSLLEELTTQEKSMCTGHFLSYDSVNHVFPDLLHQVLSSCRENSFMNMCKQTGTARKIPFFF